MRFWLFIVAAMGSVTVSAGEERLVIIGHQLTEIVFELGADDQVVGLHGYVDHIPGAAGLPRLRGPRQTSAEGVLSFRPTTVWVMEDRASPEMLRQLEGVGVSVVSFPGDWALDEVPRRVVEVAEGLGRREAGEALARRFVEELNAISEMPPPAPRRAMFVLGGGGRPLLVAGKDTTVAKMISLAGGVNVTEHSGYQLLGPEAIMRSAPELILMLADAKRDDGQPVILDLPGIRHTPAAREQRWQVVEGHCISGGMSLSTPACIRAIRRSLDDVSS